LIYNDGGVLNGIAEFKWTDTGGSENLNLAAGSDVALFTMSQAGSGSAAEITGEFKATAAHVTTITAATDTLDALAQAGEVIDCNRGTLQIITIPEDPALGTTYLIIQRGAGQVTISRTGSDTINGATSVTIQNQYGAATLIYVASHIWLAVGDL
jgi:hypothetical protein